MALLYVASGFSWSHVAGVVVLYYVLLACYRLWLHPLAGFPGPRLAAISRWYEGYYDLVLGGKYTLKIRDLHKRYGPIIRISPHELHVSDPAFNDTIYRMNGRWDKYAWTYDATGVPKSTVFTVDHDAHKARRAALAPLFSKAKIAARQDLIHKNVDRLCQRISDLGAKTFDLGAAISALARDTANEFVLGNEYGELNAEDFNVALSIAALGAGAIWRTTKFIRWFGPALRSIPPAWAMKRGDEGTRSFFRTRQRYERDTREVLAAATSPNSESKLQNTLVHAIVNSDLPASEKTYQRVCDEVTTVAVAGFESTASALRLILYHVFSSDTILQRLRRELASAAAAAGSSEPIPLKTLEQLPYLTSVLMEGLRLSPGIATRTARITDKDLVYGSWRIPAGTPVGMTTLLMHTDEQNFPEPMRFDPDRWVDPRDRRAAEKAYAPFSRGTRICLGMHLAWAEMYLVVAALVQRFNFTFEGVTAADFEFQADNFGISTRAGCHLIAKASPAEIGVVDTA
ncbi:uncharacterized protein THITE_2057681 [Thermothielavioides terrestris NRRL 8126]|uniref:Trichodiene oxygenase n=1 Tax=Thermothielavioides terrestris (strain ATCC 38088 / NRRL 8126) TaxID=578455 RepID=G2RD74_THETT|nr:uncharacterized protein THITE_2057681 [Thermothielavioides terrestris NRRL 8126]AEO69909.1 hypothetical protein THITE_2057681 [Thermothielavioides terrestris NRRL 8126]